MVPALTLPAKSTVPVAFMETGEGLPGKPR